MVTSDIFFSPSHLGLIASMFVILTSPLRSAWSDPALGTAPSLRALAPAVFALSFAATLVLLFLTYGNALLYDPGQIVDGFSDLKGRASTLAVRMVVTNLVLLAPLLLLARRWQLPPGAATIGYLSAALLSGMLTGLRNIPVLLAMVAAGVVVDLLAPLATWGLYLGVAIAVVDRFPAVAALWTGAPVVAALLGWTLAALLLPDPVSTAPRRAELTPS